MVEMERRDGVKDAFVFHHSKKDTGIDRLLRVLSSTLARTPSSPHIDYMYLKIPFFGQVFVDYLN